MRRVWLAIWLMTMSLVLATGFFQSISFAEDTSSSPVPIVTILSNRDYFPMVHRAFQEADSSIMVMMYVARYYTEKPRHAPEDMEHEPGTHWSNTNVLLDDLVAARERGVDVLIILDNSSWNDSNTELNEDFGRLLVEGGVMVYMDDPEVSTHAKLILVDDDLTVVGSTNWSWYALDQNNETSVLIHSTEVNQVYREFFSEVLVNSTSLSIAEGD